MGHQKMKHLLIVSLGLISVGCRSSRSFDENYLEVQAANQSLRYICADSIVPRDENLKEIKDFSLNYGDKVTFLMKTKRGTGELAEHGFANVKLQSGKTAWISSKFLKVMPCQKVASGPIAGSVLAFTQESPGILAMLDAIAYAEFRFNPESTNSDAYKTIFDYLYFSSFKGHPRRENCSRGICSDAAGRYQFLSSTWDTYQKFLSERPVPEIKWLKGPLPDFSPESQDKMAIFALWFKFGYESLKVIRMGDNGTLDQVTRKLAMEWASLPGSPHGQGTLDWPSFRNYYWKRFQHYNK
jgi:muramidase (phage lysozyme)